MTDQTKQTAATDEQAGAPPVAKPRKPRAVKTAPKPKPVAAKKTAPTKTPTKKTAAPKVKDTNAHIDAGIDISLYDGPSSFVNGNRKTKIKLRAAIPESKVTPRAQKGLYALRRCYGQRHFNPRGFDNGILRDLAAAGLISLSKGQKAVIDGAEYMIDGAQPVSVVITAAGTAYGKA